jgi:hypothetical protein
MEIPTLCVCVCRKIKGLYENRLRANQQKAYRMEQALLNQTFQVKY